MLILLLLKDFPWVMNFIFLLFFFPVSPVKDYEHLCLLHEFITIKTYFPKSVSKAWKATKSKSLSLKCCLIISIVSFLDWIIFCNLYDSWVLSVELDLQVTVTPKAEAR